MLKKAFFICVVPVALAFSFCSKSSDTASSSSRIMGALHNQFSVFNFAPLIKNISENFIYKNYVELEAKVNSLKTLTNELPDSCGGDNAKLVAIQEAWKSAFSALKIIEIVQIGPSGSYTTIDSWPANYVVNPPDTAKIETIIVGTETISETALSAKLDNEIGFPAIEYLLFDNGSGLTQATNICNSLTGRRKLYLQEAVKLLSTRITRVTLNWNPAFSGNFTTVLQTAGANNEFYKSEKEVVDTLIKQIVSIVEKVKDDKVGYPSGFSVDSGGVIRSTNVEAKYANLSMKAIRDNLNGLYAFYVGNDGPGISDYVRYYNISLDERIRSKMRQAQAKALEISDLKGDLLAGNTIKAKELNVITNELKILFTVELAGNLGSSFRPGLGDGDGD